VGFSWAITKLIYPMVWGRDVEYLKAGDPIDSNGYQGYRAFGDFDKIRMKG
jgi:hypothetical protein